MKVSCISQNKNLLNSKNSISFKNTTSSEKNDSFQLTEKEKQTVQNNYTRGGFSIGGLFGTVVGGIAALNWENTVSNPKIREEILLLSFPIILGAALGSLVGHLKGKEISKLPRNQVFPTQNTIIIVNNQKK